LDRSILDALVGLEHDLTAGTRPVLEPVGLQEIDGLLAFRTRQRELIEELAARRCVERDQADEEHDPAGHDTAAPTVHGAGKTL
jgi:hypothetical protein